MVVNWKEPWRNRSTGINAKCRMWLTDEAGEGEARRVLRESGSRADVINDPALERALSRARRVRLLILEWEGPVGRSRLGSI